MFITCSIHVLHGYMYIVIMHVHALINTLRFLVSVCVSVTDVGVAVTNLRFVCKTITCVSAFTEMAIIFLEIVKTAAGLDTLRCGRGRNEFAVRVQNHHVRFSFHRNGHYLS